MDLPSYKKVTKVQHEWTIGREDRFTAAKEFRFGIHHVQREMERLGLQIESDDCFFVRAGEGGEVIIFVEAADDER